MGRLEALRAWPDRCGQQAREHTDGIAVSAVGLTEVVPFLLADALIERGAIHQPAPNWRPQVVRSGRLVTGQNPASATGVAEQVLAALA